MSLALLNKISICSYTLSRHMAGHSKWNNIKHIKGAKDAERSLIYQRLYKRMRTIIRENGNADPKSNVQLAHVIEQARQQNMPVEKIQQILKGTDASKDDLKPHLLEVKGPGGSFFLLDLLTSSMTRTKQGIAAIIKKNQGQWADGVANRAFEHKGLVRVDPLRDNQTVEQALDDAIEVGAEDVTCDEDGKFLFVTPPLEFYKVQNAISRKGYKILDSDLRYVPLSTVSLGEEEMEVASKLYQKLNEEPDVIKIYDNIA